MVETTALKRVGIVLAGAAVAAVLAVALFGIVPLVTALGAFEVAFGVVLFVGVTTLAVRLAGNVVSDYDVAEVEIDDVITRDGDGGPGPISRGAVSANDIVEQIERADADDAAEALIVRLNTPGGAVVPSEDIRQAAADFEGPTIAYAEDTAASGGYWIASGCDEIHARRGAVVGSIGVNGVQLGRTGLAEKAGLEYRRFVAGEYKDTPAVWRELEEDEVEYFQGLLDGFYEQFVETVTDGRELEAGVVRDTEARIYLGEDAVENGLVDHCGPREELEDRLAEELGVEEIAVERFEPEKGLTDRLSVGARGVAAAFGAGIASAVADGDVPDIRV